MRPINNTHGGRKYIVVFQENFLKDGRKLRAEHQVGEWFRRRRQKQKRGRRE